MKAINLRKETHEFQKVLIVRALTYADTLTEAASLLGITKGGLSMKLSDLKINNPFARGLNKNEGKKNGNSNHKHK